MGSGESSATAPQFLGFAPFAICFANSECPNATESRHSPIVPFSRSRRNGFRAGWVARTLCYMRDRIARLRVSQLRLAAIPLLVATTALANGESEYVAPLDVPVSSTPGRAIPFPVVEEAQPRGTPSNAIEMLPEDFALLRIQGLAQPSSQQNAVGGKSECFQTIVLRGSRIDPGKVTIPAGGLGYVTETWPAALPLRQDVICIAGVPNTLVDIEQSIVTRKNVTLASGEGTVLGSEVFRLRSVTEFGDARSAVIEVSALSGFDWARLGTGSLEVSTTEPGWHAKTFHYGMHQGRVEEVTPKSVRFAWLSGIRTDSVVLAEKREFAATVGSGTDIPISGGGQIRVVRVTGALKQVELDTPDGPKILSANVDLRGLPADTAARKKIIATGQTFAALLVPDASDFSTDRAHLEVYSGIRQYRHGNVVPDARNFKTYPIAHYTGAVVGIYWVNDQPIELTPGTATFAGPYDAFKLISTWNKGGEITAFQLQDAQGAKSVALSTIGRKSINTLAGNGPTMHSMLARVGASAAGELHERLSQCLSVPPGPSPGELRTLALDQQRQAERAESWLSPKRVRTALLPALLGLVLGVLMGLMIGRARRRPRVTQ